MFLFHKHPLRAPAEDGTEGAASTAAVDQALADRGDKAIPDDADVVAGNDDKPAASDKDAAAAQADTVDGDDKAAKPQVMIPKVRFDEARRKDRERIKALESELSKGARQADPNAPAKRVAELEQTSNKLMDSYAKALEDGDTKKAAELMNQIRQADREAMRIEASVTSARDREIAVEQVRLDMLIDSLEEKYPQLKEGDDEYDEDLVTEIQDLRGAFEAKGYASSEALKRAMKYALRESGETGASVTADVDRAVKLADRAANTAEKAQALAAERKADAVRRNIKVAGKTPADTNKTPGIDSHKLGGGKDLESVKSFSEADMAALPDATRRKLRGDFYEPAI